MRKPVRIVGYYAAWNQTPKDINADQLTHINYAFANIGSDLKIELGFPDVDEKNIYQLNELKKVNPKLKTLISVGGWIWSGKFSDAVLTEESRTAFADSVIDFIVKYQFDGVDIDWEYPVGGGLPANTARPEDKQNFTLLMQKLREKLDERGKIDGKHYLLTFAGATLTRYLNSIELDKLVRYVDYVNVMTYDIHGARDQFTDFNAPLFINSDISPQYKWSVDSGITNWIETGFPKEKIVMGIPFYGYKYEDVPDINHGLYQTFSQGNSIGYDEIVRYYLGNPDFIRFFHEESKVPWLFNGSTFISYDDEESIGWKAKYIKDKGLGGAMIWELGQDYEGVLLNSLYNDLYGCK
ncbi:MAG: glycoside hydrolase family 18 protein [Anaerocolumna aminovalerica]|uniref:glycoside hydrolase family 18 protein n=1 Tax=Anaerocolumna aminovalerica TaxID=1527 RepID=UPI001596853B|nr:glycoside hydrolase family 18 protein [Anaerocolumna aminovalerica]MDU6266290.1 glycoside hydrolase family 18 protein [Anaerocolumna aminovalerica]